MTDRDPLDILSSVSDVHRLPDDSFTDRLEADLVAQIDEAIRTAPVILRQQIDDIPLEELTMSALPDPKTFDRRWLLAVAAALILIVVLSTRVFSGDDNALLTDEPEVTTTLPEQTDSSVVTEPPTSTTEPNESATTTSVAPSSSLDPAEAAWQDIPALLFAGSKGELRTNTFSVPFRFDTAGVPVTKDWEREDWFAIASDEVAGWIDVFVGLDSVEATVEEFRNMHDFYDSAEMNEPVPATLGGADGLVIQSVGLPVGVDLADSDRHEFLAPITQRGQWAGGGAYGLASPGRSGPDSPGVSIWVGEVSGQVAVVAQSSIDMQNTLEERDLARQGIRELMDSIVWKDVAQ